MITADNRRPEGEANTWEECVRIGTLLADECLRLVQDAPVQTNPPLQVVSREVKFPVESPLMLAVLKASPLGYRTDASGRVTTRVNLVDVGTARILDLDRASREEGSGPSSAPESSKARGS